MHEYQYKEKDHALQILNNGFLSKHINSELKILAKYFNEQDKTEEDIKQSLHDFCKTNLKGYNEAVHFKIINGAIKFGTNNKNKLIQIDKIDITKSELHVIEQMDLPHKFKRVVFTLLVLTKLSKEFLKIRDGEIKNQEYYFGGYKHYKELVSVSKITFNKKKKSTVKNIHDLVHLLDEKGVVEITNNGNIKLSFMYDIENDKDVAFSVNDYRVIGLYYDLYYGENRVKQCENCNIPIRANSSTTKYCKECSIDIERRRQREKWHKYKEKYHTT
ncbi:hypothetical protein [Heyndrickxia camelliae]|uniref:Uncharacterized protein n=1 Tax=Heyndrickxia camelliae TaxID=1707093 RepID=A0A2N3LE29_9BACI|nr:hypothetical protein [Heyndrickxia camelliae]PKR82866.1 hypothetical protein CWO92_22000 [Heyndrickxia camelliae]